MFGASLELLDESLRADPHFESEGIAGGPSPLVEANGMPRYAVFKDDAGDLLVAPFFGPNLPPGRLDQAAVEGLQACT